MSDERRYRGLWWIPNADNAAGGVKKVGGILTIDAAGRVQLEVMSPLVNGREDDGTIRRSSRSLDEPTLIHGAAEGKQITLLNCLQISGQTSVVPVYTETQVFLAEAGVVGYWLGSTDEQAFVGMRVEMSHLTEWSGMSGLTEGISAAHPEDEQSATVASREAYTLTLSTVPTESVELPDEQIRVRLLSEQSFGPGGKDNAWGRTKQIRERTLYEVLAPQPRDALDAFRDAVRPMQNVLTLATQSPCAVGGREFILAVPDEVGGPRVELFFHGEDIEIKSSREWYDLLFTLDDLGGLQALSKWYALSREIGRPLDVLFGLDYETGGYYETRLFTVATVVEGFHAALFPTSTALDPDDHKLIRTLAKEALKELAEDLRAWASTKLRHNDSGYTKRCKELASLVDPTALENLLGDTEVWAKWLAHARNVGAHGNLKELRHKSASEDAYYLLAATTQHLLHLVLMSKLGVDGSLQQRAVAEKWGYQARRFRDLVAQENT
ncbi:ApeA N-terminal domain 1-containing protein [Gordonia amicalis]|uniref:ApeA N-terminal domain 1-containing protein n=1 Tax=Gordonia amicalis TaxID=89053 RepID=UPI0015F6C8A3|nr:HEPN domain-containing protein [Gordonia amicalis]MBA5846327.1 hypothetical protein [Gordonia amicalis]